LQQAALGLLHTEEVRS